MSGASRSEALRDALERIANSDYADSYARSIARGTLEADECDRAAREELLSAINTAVDCHREWSVTEIDRHLADVKRLAAKL